MDCWVPVGSVLIVPYFGEGRTAPVRERQRRGLRIKLEKQAAIGGATDDATASRPVC
jgi:hypothetical protein